MLPQYVIVTYKTLQDFEKDKPSCLCAVTAYSISRALSRAQEENLFKEMEQEVFIIRRQQEIKAPEDLT